MSSIWMLYTSKPKEHTKKLCENSSEKTQIPWDIVLHCWRQRLDKGVYAEDSAEKLQEWISHQKMFQTAKIREHE